MDIDYRLFKQIKGHGSFAQVYIQLVAWDKQDEQIAFTTTTKIESSEWIDCAKKGACEALNALKRIGISIASYQVVITKIITTYVDTSDDAVYAATFLAIIKGFDLLDHFELVFDGGWKVLPKK